MMKFFIKRPDDEIEVLLLKNKEESTYSFVNITKGHICPCKFNSIEEAIEDLEKYKKEGKLISYEKILILNAAQVLLLWWSRQVGG